MLLFITDIAAGSDMEGMNSVMTAVVTSAVMNSAACNDRYSCSILYIEIIIHLIGHSRSIDNNRNMHVFTVGITTDYHVDSRLVLLALNLNMLRVPMTKRITIVS